MIRVVFDTVVFVRALINPHSACGRLLFAYCSQFQLIVSPPLIREVIKVLHRPELTRKFRSLGRLDLARVLQILAAAESVDPGSFEPVSRDPNDDAILATARVASADYLVSDNKDLLVLHPYEGVQIVGCQELLRVLSE